MSWSIRVGLASRLIPVLAVSLMSAIGARAEGPTTSVQTEYLMTFYANLDTAQAIDAGMQVIPITGGWVEGPRIKGRIVPPAGDWGHVLPSGVFRLDVRATIRTDDGEIIFVAYNGVRQCSKEVAERVVKGELIKQGDCYFIAAPTFETKSERYGWLNGVQAVGKALELKRGDHVSYDIFAVK
jgi:Protein of unknown function (DUF3237)